MEQNHILGKFRTELTAEGFLDTDKFDDAMLLRFLRARKFDLAKAKIMWIDFIKWRTDFKVDELYEHFEYPELVEVDKLYPKFYHKTDKDGRPVYIEILGKIDVNKLYQVTTQERQLQRLVVEYERFLRERLPVCSEVTGELVETSCTIMDLKGVGISQFWNVKAFVQSAADVSQNNYPETMGKFYIINAPWAFKTVWGFVKPWLDEVTVSKIDILSSDYIKTLAQQIPLENLPKFLGGKCECQGGCTLSNAGPWQDKALVEKVLAKNKAGRKPANGNVQASDKEAAPASEAESVGAAAATATASTSTASAPPVEPAAIETPLPETSTVDKLQQDLANVKMTVVESKVDS